MRKSPARVTLVAALSSLASLGAPASTASVIYRTVWLNTVVHANGTYSGSGGTD